MRAFVTVDYDHAQEMPTDEWLSLATTIRNTLARQWGGVSVFTGIGTHAMVWEQPSPGRVAVDPEPAS